MTVQTIVFISYEKREEIMLILNKNQRINTYIYKQENILDL